MSEKGFWSTIGFERNVVVLGLTSTIATFGNALWYYFLPLLFQNFTFNGEDIGLIYTVSLAVSALVQIPMGAFSDWFGKKNSIIVGGIIQAIEMGFLGTVILFSSLSESRSLYLLGILTALVYVLFSGSGPLISVARSALIMDSVPEESLATGFGAFLTLAGIAPIVAPLIGGFYFSTSDEAVIFLVSGLLTFATALLRAIFLVEKKGTHKLVARTSEIHSEPAPENHHKKCQGQNSDSLAKRKFLSFRNHFKIIISNRLLFALALAYSFYNLFISTESFTFLIPLYSYNVLHLNSAFVGILFSLDILIGSQFSIPFGKIADKLGRANIVIVSWVGEMIFMMIFAYSRNVIAVVLSFSLWIAFGALDGPSLEALLGRTTTSDTRGLSIGFFNTFTTVFLIPSSFVSGLLFSISPILPFFANLAIGIISLAFFVYSFKESIGKHPQK